MCRILQMVSCGIIITAFVQPGDHQRRVLPHSGASVALATNILDRHSKGDLIGHRLFQGSVSHLPSKKDTQESIAAEPLTSLRHMCCTKRTEWNTRGLLTIIIMGVGLSNNHDFLTLTDQFLQQNFSSDVTFKPQAQEPQTKQHRSSKSILIHVAASANTKSGGSVLALGIRSLRQKEKQFTVACLQNMT